MPHAHAWRYLTDFGSDAVMLPLMLLMAAWLGVSARTRRLAWQWLALCAAVIAAVMVTKVLYMGWHIGSRRLDFIGLSGHATLAALVWPVCALLICNRGERGLRWLALAAGYALAVGVTISRVALGVHSTSEAVLGCALGLAAATTFVAWTWPRLRSPVSGWWLLASVVLALALGYGRAFPSKQIMYALTSWYTGHAAYTRDDLSARNRP